MSVSVPAPHRVVVLALDGVYPFELGIPARIFGSAGGLYEVLTCSADGRPVRTVADFTVTTEHGPEVLATADTVVIPPSEVTDEAPEALALIRPGTRLVSICTGSYVLASAGLLDGRPATTHWHMAEEFGRRFPRVRIDPGVLFVDDGDVLTSAGAASGVDLCLHLVRKDHGSKVANQVARACVVPAWRDGGQAQYIERPVPSPSSESTAPARNWALAHLHLPLTLTELAGRAQMSGRTFARRFRREVGMSPGRWLTQQRVDRARHLLECSDLSVDRIAGEVGFATAASLRQHLQAAVGVSPLAYRRTFPAGGTERGSTRGAGAGVAASL
ncbi:GlxA family transcriptional regulator [Streptomyces pinistramenti]|uniref:GlxA family transcriptional regulator n=1 Tax=Streptomyces pinistramenti TaxID=2884812 RepID=UPI001D07D15F|nr:helix-turn-helix domain-containing protein [Streptomyces pinistramenti]MCB5908913.1 helix-turn-helix domain-containing protein [Streptomyces pinistramenti]